MTDKDAKNYLERRCLNELTPENAKKTYLERLSPEDQVQVCHGGRNGGLQRLLRQEALQDVEEAGHRLRPALNLQVLVFVLLLQLPQQD